MTRVPVYILAGGKSSRFGSDKARAPFKGRPLIAQVAASLRPVAESVTVVADVPHKFSDLGMRTIPDMRARQGPLGGLRTAIADLSADVEEDEELDGWMLLTSCDVVEPNAEWVQTLLDARRDGAEAVAFRHKWWEPTLALYHIGVLRRVTRQLAESDFKLQHLLDDIETVAVDMPDGMEELPQINTPEDLERFS
ncbi:MAG: NTP transferase domain-containing protein [Phycisphaera sp.]|nr:NTP transferase domain-containing protein [Phycisphaera sp.]